MKRRVPSGGMVLLALCLLHGCSGPQEKIEREARRLAKAYLAREVVRQGLPELTSQQALEVQTSFVRQIETEMGGVVGYKAGLTSTATQNLFGINHPLLGMLFARALLPSGTIVPASFGSRPMLEGDLIVRVADARLNEAKTMEEALAALDAVYPFMELVDMVYGENVKLSANELLGVNVGARSGILGDAIPLGPQIDWIYQLGSFAVSLTNDAGDELASGQGTILLGHPLKAVLWLVEAVNARGGSLKKGDLLSLGSVTRLLPVEAGQTFTARYDGLAPEGPVRISVTFE